MNKSLLSAAYSTIKRKKRTVNSLRLIADIT